MRKLAVIILLILGIKAQGQTPETIYGDYVYPGNVFFNNGIYIPVKDTLNNPKKRVGAQTIRPQDTVGHPAYVPIYTWNGASWVIGSFDGTNYYTKSQSDARFVHYADTAAMLLPYLRKIDTTGMLNNYYTKTQSDSRYPLLSGSYANPSWIASLPWSKITGTPTTLSGYGITDAVPTTRSINTTSPLSGGGNLSADRTLSIANAAADGATKGAATFNASDFNDNGAGTISLDVPNGPFVAKTDTAGMLNNYLRNVGRNSALDTMRFLSGSGTISIPSISWQTKLTPLVTQPALPIQPTDSVPQALGKLQAQINGFDGTYIKLNSATAQTGAAAYIQGKLNIKGNPGTTYALMLERTNLNTDDNLIGFKSVTDTVARFGMLNRGFNHVTLDNLRDNIRIVMRDTARIEMVTLNPNNTGKTGFIFNNGKVQLGDSLPGAKIMPGYPLHIINAQDTSISALHKIYTPATVHAAGATFGGTVNGVTESLSDNSTKLASTAFVKGQNYTTAQSLQQVTDVGNTTTTRVIVNAAAASAYAGTFTNTGTGAYHGVYINTSSASTGNAFRVDRNSVQKFLVDSDGETTITSLATAVTTVTGNTTLDATHFTVRVNNTGSVTITLPAANTYPGRVYVIKKVSAASNDVVIDPNAAETIDGGASKTLTLQYSSLIIQSNGSGWDIVGAHAAATTY